LAPTVVGGFERLGDLAGDLQGFVEPDCAAFEALG
jgi:hypothetical protein